MAINIRLTPELDALARAYCARVGISVNGLVSVALDAYLQQPKEHAAVPAAPVQSVQPDPQPVPKGEPVKVPEKPSEPRERLERIKQTLTAAPFVQPEPKPVLPANPSKADRAKLAEWYRLNPSKPAK